MRASGASWVGEQRCISLEPKSPTRHGNHEAISAPVAKAQHGPSVEGAYHDMPKQLFRLAALAGIAAIAACAPEIEGRLYLQDILEVADTNTPVDRSRRSCAFPKARRTSARRAWPISPPSSSRSPRSQGEGACVEVDNNQFSQFDMDLPIVPPGATLDVGLSGGADRRQRRRRDRTGRRAQLGLSRALADVQDAIGRGADSGVLGSSWIRKNSPSSCSPSRTTPATPPD